MQNPSQDKAKRTLTGREKEVIEYLSMGLTYDEIATQLNVSPETVKMHLKNIYRKLQVKNKIEALNKMKLL
ncbi:MAG TPA: helix-turn-helix transcriptional regulator [Chitinophagaceae bacterium]|nr:helix-turn-helix transcriptional regulator [Chitinophagaceae bacterium]